MAARTTTPATTLAAMMAVLWFEDLVLEGSEEELFEESGEEVVELSFAALAVGSLAVDVMMEVRMTIEVCPLALWVEDLTVV